MFDNYIRTHIENNNNNLNKQDIIILARSISEIESVPYMDALYHVILYVQNETTITY